MVIQGKGVIDLAAPHGFKRCGSPITIAIKVNCACAWNQPYAADKGEFPPHGQCRARVTAADEDSILVG